MTDGSFFDPTADSDGPTVFLGAQVPLRLYQLVEQEANRSMVHRAQVLRWALAERYRAPADGETPARS